MPARYTDDALIAMVRERVVFSDSDRAELDAAVATLTAQHTVRTVGGLILVEALRGAHPDIAQELSALIEGRSSFSNTGLNAAVHFYALAARQLYPERPLRDAINDLMEQAILANREVPFVKIILRTTGGRWEEFLAGLKGWVALVSTESTEFHVDLDRRRFEAINRGPAALAINYFEVGFARALMRFFERTAHHRYLEREPGYTLLEIQWDEG